MRYNILYKTTNLVNGKIYIGVHSTENLDDGYLGSGVALLRAIKKHGSDCFSRVILGFYYTFQAALADEARLVNEDFFKDRNNYNMTYGGMGGLHFKGRIIPKDELRKRIKTRKSKNPIYQPEMISWIQELIDAGTSAKEIAVLLNQKEVKNTHGNEWTETVFQNYVKRLKANGSLRDRSIDSKNCQWCNAQFHFDRSKMKLSKFNRKKCCSYSCMAKLRWSTDRSDQKIKEKSCIVCNESFVPKGSNKIETCSRSCSAKLSHQREISEIRCAHCKTEFTPKHSKRVYCSSDCYQKSRKAS